MNPIKAFFLPREELKRFVYMPSVDRKELKKFKYGIVLGCKNTGIMYERLRYAVSLYKEGKFDTFVLVGGRGYFGKVSEAKEMTIELKRQFSNQGTNIKYIIEDKSKNTIQNAENLYKILNCSGYELLLVTSAFHLQRALKIFKKFFPGITGEPTPVNENLSSLLLRLEAFLIACQK